MSRDTSLAGAHGRNAGVSETVSRIQARALNLETSCNPLFPKSRNPPFFRSLTLELLAPLKLLPSRPSCRSNCYSAAADGNSLNCNLNRYCVPGIALSKIRLARLTTVTNATRRGYYYVFSAAVARPAPLLPNEPYERRNRSLSTRVSTRLYASLLTFHKYAHTLAR